MYVISSRGGTYQLFFAKDGSSKSSNGGTGNWQVKNGSICNTYIAKGFAGCDKVYRKENNQIFYVVDNGRKGKIHKTVAGNKL